MTEPVYRRVVVKVSGEALMGPDAFGIHQPTLEGIAADLVAARALGVSVAVVAGGGEIFSGVQGARKSNSRRTRGMIRVLPPLPKYLAPWRADEEGGIDAPAPAGRS